MIAVPRISDDEGIRSTDVQGFQSFGQRFLDYFSTTINHFFVINPSENRVFHL